MANHVTEATPKRLSPYDYLRGIQELIKTGATANLPHWGDGKFAVGENGKWHFEGFISLFRALHEAMRLVDPTLPPGLPPHCFDAEFVAKFFGLPLEDFNWQGCGKSSEGMVEKNQPAMNLGLAPKGKTRPEFSLIAKSLERIADVLDPLPSKIVDSPYVAKRLDCTTVWVAEMARNGQIPKNCIVPGTGNGKLWKFYRTQIDEWVESR